MSTYAKVTTVCPICGKSFESKVLTSASSFGSQDLDSRPAPMRRYTMDTWVHHCPHCGFSAQSMKDADGATKESIDAFYSESRELIKTVSGAGKETLAEFFLQVYSRRLNEGNFENAFLIALSAAWDCDDRKNTEGATCCRNLAIEALEHVDNPVADYDAIKADMLRRAGRFDEVVERFSSYHSDKELINKVIAFQIEKAKASDATCYTMDDVL